MNLVRHISAARAAKLLGVTNKTLVAWKSSRNFPIKALNMKHYERMRWRVYVSDLAFWIWDNKYWGKCSKEDVRKTLRATLEHLDHKDSSHLQKPPEPET